MKKTTANNYIISLFTAALLASCLPAFLFKGIHPRVALNAVLHIAAAVILWNTRKHFAGVDFRIHDERSLGTATWMTLLAAAGAHYVLDAILTASLYAVLSMFLPEMPDNILRLSLAALSMGAVGLTTKTFLRADMLEKKLKSILAA